MNIDTIIVTHGIKSHPNHVRSGSDVYVLTHCKGKRTQHEKKLSMQMNGLTRGYFIYRKFRSLTWIERHSYPLTKILFKAEKMPF